MKHRSLGFALFSALGLVSWTARAAQRVVVDADYTHGPDTTKDSHYYVVVPAGTPSNWQSPVNFAGGQAVVELQVKTKPTDAETRFQVCFISKPDYSCTDQSPVYSETGTVTWATDFSDFYIGNGGSVDWSLGAKDISLILKDTHNVKPAPENVGAQTAALYMPTDLHIIVTLVPEGETYVPPDSQPEPGTGGSGGVAGSSGSAGAGSGGSSGGGAGGTAAGAGEAAGGSVGALPIPEPAMPTAGGAAGAGGAASWPAAAASLDQGCACRAPRSSSGTRPILPALLAGLAALARLRRRR